MLNPKQERFCTEYLKCGNQATAYRVAFGTTNANSARACASRLLASPEVQARLAELQAEVTSAEICAAHEIQARLSSIARREVVETVCLPNGEQTQRQTTVRDSLKALELLAKISGLTTKQELEINGALPIVVRDDI